MQKTPETRESLLLRIRDRGDAVAWQEFVEIYEPLVYRLVGSRGRLQDADAWDLTQQVLLAVARRVETWNPDPGRGSFRGWLSRVARNLVINFLVHRKRHPQGTGDSEFQQVLERVAVTDSDESARFDLEHRRQLFRWAAERIRGEFRASSWNAFWQTCVENRPVKQVADTLGMSVGAVYISRSRVLARLRCRIEQQERS